VVREIASTNISLPKAVVIGLLATVLSCATQYYVGWSGVQTALARHDAQRQGDVALNDEVHQAIRRDVAEVKNEIGKCVRQIGDLRVDVGALANANGRKGLMQAN
jgi:hypothetical protein